MVLAAGFTCIIAQRVYQLLLLGTSFTFYVKSQITFFFIPGPFIGFILRNPYLEESLKSVFHKLILIYEIR
ncbi:MAG: hypothetical protein EA341_18180, partial [Mongoliibacter sp.]